MAETMPAKPNGEKLGFEPFGTLAGVLSGEPVKIMPLGTFYRDTRKLVITEGDLKEIEQNFKAGLPRFRVPINENHQNNGKIGTVKDVEFKPSGADGPGLYAVLDLTDEGKDLLKRGRYDAVSPEMVWQKAGATYQDPVTNRKVSNCLIGLAVTDRPYFSHDHVALFTAQPPTETDTMADDTAKPRRGNGFTAFRDKMKSFLAEIDAYLKDEDGDGVPDGEAPAMPAEMDKEHEGMSAEIPVAGAADKPAADAAVQGAETMADKDQTPATPPAPEQMTQVVSVEEFAAVKAQLEAEQKARAEIAERLTAAERRTRLAGWAAKVEHFTAAPDGLAEKFMALEDHDAALAEYFAGLVETLDTQVAQGALFAQRGSARKATANVETLADLASQFVADKFDGDMGKWEQAMNLAGEKRPDLLAAYLRAAPADKE